MANIDWHALEREMKRRDPEVEAEVARLLRSQVDRGQLWRKREGKYVHN